tara:strand:- start:5285 stop:5806 length:522 start_codon:yes stop_codon:yes gene_type:complete
VAGSLIKIDEEIVTSGVASVTLGGSNWDNSYDVYMVQVINVATDTDAQGLRFRFTVSGSPDTSSNYDRAFKNLRADSAFSDINYTNQAELDLGNIGTGTQEVANAKQYLFNFNNASEYSFCTVEASNRNNNSNLRGFQGGGTLKETQLTDGVHYFMASGNISSGIFKLYGYKK